MLHAALVVLGVFALCVFLLLNGPLWLIVRLRFLAHDPEAPRRLVLFIRRASRIVAIVGILLWLTTVSRGNVSNASLLGVSLIGAAFLLLNGPTWIATRLPFVRGKGSKAPKGLQIGGTWFSRLLGAGIAAHSLYLAFRLQLPDS